MPRGAKRSPILCMHMKKRCGGIEEVLEEWTAWEQRTGEKSILLATQLLGGDIDDKGTM